MIDLKKFQIYNEYLPKNIYEKIVNLVYKAKEDANNVLAGNITREYLLHAEDDPEIHKYLLELSNNSLFHDYHRNLSNMFSERITAKPILKKTWVNFQKKHEFNPIHTHDGIFSFVIFIKIPYDCKDFLKNFPKARPQDVKAGMLSFGIIDPWSNRITTSDVPLNPKYEGGIYYFKADHVHQVYPFYNTDEDRITVSGNVTFKS